MSDKDAKAVISGGVVLINGEAHPVADVEIDVDLSDLTTQETWSHHFQECDECGRKIHPADATIVAGNLGHTNGVFHSDCLPE